MNTRWPRLFALLTLLLFLAPARAAEEPQPEEQVNRESWFELRISGRKTGYIHATIDDVVYEGRTVHRVTSTYVSWMSRGEERFYSRSRDITWEETDGRLIQRFSEERDGGQHTTTRVWVTADRVKVQKTLNGNEEKTSVPIPEGTVIVESPELLLDQVGLVEGEAKVFTVFSESSMGLETETVTLMGREKHAFEGEEIDVLVFTTARSNIPGLTGRYVATPAFELLGFSVGPMEVVRVSEEQAKAVDTRYFDLEKDIAVDGAVPAWTELEAMTLRLYVDSDEEGALFKSTPYGAVIAAKPGEYELTLVERPAPETCDDTLPIEPDDEEARRCLEPALMFQSDSEEVRAVVGEVVGEEKNALAAVRKLCGWVHDHIDQRSIKTGAASALETLETRAGDCTEHAALMCALARAAGVPARQASGFTFRDEGLYPHAWAEVYLGGEWVPVDTTIGFVGLPAGQLLTETYDGKTEKLDKFATFIALLTGVRAEISSVTRRGETFDPRNPDESVTATETEYEDRLNDYALDLSGGVEVLGEDSFETPDGLWISVAALSSLMATQEDADEVLRELKQFISDPVQTKPPQSVPGGTVFGIAFDTSEDAVGEIRFYTVGRRTLCVTVISPRELVENSPEKVEAAFDRVIVPTFGPAVTADEE